MTKFEKFLIEEKGWLWFKYNVKTSRFYKSEHHTVSTTDNLVIYYIHKDNKRLLDKIERNEEIIKEDLSGNIIIFGLNEYKKPPTLIYPRPWIFNPSNDNVNAIYDDEMNKILATTPFEELYKQIIP